MRVLVCGGRDYDTDHVWNELHRLYSVRGPFRVIIHGFSGNVDMEAENVARSLGGFGCRSIGYRAEWDKHGRAAGPIRNQRMLDEGKPDLVIAFPGGRGTADMVRRAKAAGVEVIEVPNLAPTKVG